MGSNTGNRKGREVGGGGGEWRGEKEHRVHRKWKIGGIEAELLPAADVFSVLGSELAFRGRLLKRSR